MATGNVKAIGDWFRGTRYLKDDVDELFLLNNQYTAYKITIIDIKDSNITITGQTSGQTYTFKMADDQVSKLMFFTSGETITVTDGEKTITKALTDQYVTISFVVYLLKDGIINTSIGNGIEVIAQTNGRSNYSTIATDKYLRLYYVNETYGDAMMYSKSKINIRNYSRLIVKFKLVGDHSGADDVYKFRIGFDDTKTREGGKQYHTWYSNTFTPSNDIQVYNLNLADVSSSITSDYLRIGAVQRDAYIYEIKFKL